MKYLITILLFSASLYAAEFTADANTVALWHFNEGSGTTLTDASGNGHHGTINGATWANGIEGNALSFDGASDYVETIGNLPAFGNNPVSLEAWAYLVGDPANKDHFIIEIGNDASLQEFGISTWSGGSSPKGEFLVANFGANLESNIFPRMGNWYYLAATWDGTTASLYVNGLLATSSTWNARNFPGTHAVIGRHIQQSNHYWNGKLDEIRISNISRTASEISSHWEANKEKATLVAYWDFNDGAGITLTDKSIYGNNGVITGATWVDGIEGKALNFNGTSDYVEIVENGSLDILNEITISAWVNFDVVDSGSVGTWDSTDNGIISKQQAYYLTEAYTATANLTVNGGGSANVTEGKTNLNGFLGQWIHIAGTINGNMGKIYVNGALDSSFTNSSLLTESDSAVRIGWVSYSRYLDGQIDEIKIYNRALNSTEIQYLFNNPGLPPVGEAPKLIATPSPTNNLRPTFMWRAVDSAATYVIEIDDNSDFSSLIVTTPVGDTSFIPLVDLPTDTIYWRVSSNLNPTLFSPAGMVIILDPSVPLAIKYPSPTQNKRPTLMWLPVDSATTYTIEIDDNSDFSSLIVTTPTGDTFFTPLIDLPTGWVYWRIKSDLIANFSPIDSFLILSDSVPFPYTFNGGETNNVRPVFKWKPVTGATNYNIEISVENTFASPVIQTPVGDTTFTPVVDLADGTYFWRVSADLSPTGFSPVDSLIVKKPTVEIINEESRNEITNLSATPNPFNPSTLIRFPNKMENADVLIVDLLGRQVFESSNFKGTSIRWTAQHLPNGIYLLKVHSDGKVFKKKLNLLK